VGDRECRLARPPDSEERAMPRYFFNVVDGVSLPDPDGVELPDLRTARIEAIRFSAQCLSEAADSFWDSEEWRLNVTDDHGLILFYLQISGMHAPAASDPMHRGPAPAV
jgi:hypothetical protein